MRSRAWAGVALATALVLTGCAGGSAAPDEEEDGGSAAEIDPDGTFRYVFVQNPSTLDPARSTNPWDMVYLRLVYDQLLWMDEDSQLQPMLATSWEFVDDGTALELELRDDVDFIDGEHFDAAAVKANLDRAMTLEGSPHIGSMARVDDIEVVDEYTVRINLNGPGGNLPSLFSSVLGSMVSPAAFDNPDLDQNPVGSGMAKMTEYIPGQVVRFERNDDYWDPDAAKAKNYEIYVQTASPTRMNMLSSGEAELTYLLPQDEEGAKAAGLNVAPSLSTTIFSLYLNAAKPGVSDPKVREALEHAIDRQALVDGVFFGAGTPVAQMLPPDHWAYNPEVTPEDPAYAYDPELAKELLAEAGYANGLDLEIIIPGLDDHRAVGEALVPMLKEVGINLTPRVVESSTTAVVFFGQSEGDFYPGAGSPIVDPTNNYQRNLRGQFSNPAENTSEEFIAAWFESLEGDTQEDRIPGIHKMIELEKPLRNTIPMFVFTPPSAWSDNVVFPEDYHPAYAPHFRGVGVTK